jgi:ABC-type transport system involved in Fe-S cluster assembly fused permease/ATPase subunit
MVEAITTGVQGIQTDATSILLVIVPVAIAICGLVFVIRRAMGWFKSMAK